MNKTHGYVQTIFRIGRILAKIVAVVCLVGAALSVVGIITLSAGVADGIKVGNTMIYGPVIREPGMSDGSLYAALSVALITCLAEAAIAFYAERYCKNELKAGTPFTLAGAAEFLRLSVIAVILSIASAAISSVVFDIFCRTMPNVAPADIDAAPSLGYAILMFVVSCIFRDGAEQIGEKAPAPQAEADAETADEKVE